MKQTDNPKRNPVGQAAGTIHAALCRLHECVCRLHECVCRLHGCVCRLHECVCRIVLVPVYLYRKFLSPLKGQSSCRFTPTCSRYCIEAVMEWGILIGLALTLWRVLRCNPFCRGGADPVPKNPLRQKRN